MQNIIKTIKYNSGAVFSSIILLTAIAIPGNVLAYSDYSDIGDYSYGGYSDYGSGYSGYSDYDAGYAGYSDYDASYAGYSDYDAYYGGYGDYVSNYGGYDYSDDYYEETYYTYYPDDSYSGGNYYQPYYGGYNYGYNYGSSGCGSNCNSRPQTGCTSNCNTRPPVVDNTQPLNGSCPTSGTYNINQNINWYANASGGTGSYTYTWSGDVSGSGSSISRSYNSTGTKRASVVIRSGTQSITRDCSVQIENRNNNNDDLEAICIVSDTRVEEGDRVTFEVEIDGGERPYDIEWRGDIDGDDEEVTERFDDEGRYHVSVRVTDDNGRSVFDDCAVVIVGDEEEDNDDSNITLVSNNVPTNGTLASGVFLSEIPYTGVAENLKMILFVLGMTLWSAFMAWVIMKRKATKLGLTQREMIEKFKKENLAKKQITA